MKIIVGFDKDLNHWEQDLLSDDIQTTLAKHGATMIRALMSPNGMILHVNLEPEQELFIQHVLKREFTGLDISFLSGEEE